MKLSFVCHGDCPGTKVAPLHVPILAVFTRAQVRKLVRSHKAEQTEKRRISRSNLRSIRKLERKPIPNTCDSLEVDRTARITL
jgi:hypothetical protein